MLPRERALLYGKIGGNPIVHYNSPSPTPLAALPPDLVSFEIDFQQPQAITSMRLYSSWADGPQAAEHRLEHSDDGSNWFHNDGLTFLWETTPGGE